MTQEGQVFLSYAREDLEVVRRVYEGLVKRGLKVWFDQEHLKSGRWMPQIDKAIAQSRYFFICLSQAALKKTGDEPGFQDEELNAAFHIARSRDDGHFTIVPVRLEDCGRGDARLSIFNQYDLFPPEQFESALDKLAALHGGSPVVKAAAEDTRTEEEKREERFLETVNSYLYAGDYQKANDTIERRIKPPPVLAKTWFRSKAELYMATMLIARAAARGEPPPFDRALKEVLAKLDHVRLVPDTLRVEGKDVIFSVLVRNDDGGFEQTWVRAGGG